MCRIRMEVKWTEGFSSVCTTLGRTQWSSSTHLSWQLVFIVQTNWFQTGSLLKFSVGKVFCIFRVCKSSLAFIIHCLSCGTCCSDGTSQNGEVWTLAQTSLYGYLVLILRYFSVSLSLLCTSSPWHRAHPTGSEQLKPSCFKMGDSRYYKMAASLTELLHTPGDCG